MSIKLTDTQLAIMRAAAERDDQLLVAIANSEGRAAQKALTR
jgi:hypothetical protein